MNRQDFSSNPDIQRGDAALVGDSKKRLKPRKAPICFGCGRSGHFQRDCPKAKKGTSHKAKTVSEKSSADSNSAYAASKDCPQNHTCFVDSGVSSHMTWNKQLLVNYKELRFRKGWLGR